ncbi:pyrroloquinoline quinone biosynthesis protein PqqB [Actimicrobium sp. CCI2.3]|uniref:pyrroloquinoline quinone biosynthesis protein PqqB n=1 Tax=Actimicrobium sp. CCI2.3 TaxID=3048616 RepID=UPI002AB3E363|nr:pyrroloquinoline quinone biosynthesis protein PqqB [Actimicrobium sp. CCI2.3]MDY7574323.1 pyrroloquinoline quinone biosynthesis protein PqqB [Actimicrobium sp. CCI2.3]MEB0023822.1 pyrroloquinoline quinone biosynthesis protein PqqB [Actimicrobium sp. CCI2.3]
MKIRILGSAAGGGFPQWNCNCFNCSGVRDGSIRATARTQSSIAVSDNGTDWVLINASPDILRQLICAPSLQPARAIRDSGICAVLLMDAQIDHVTGLLMLRERSSPLPLYATEQVFADISTGLPIASVLGHYCGVERHTIHPDGQPFVIDPLAQISFTPLTLSSKAPPYSPHRNDPHPGDNIGLMITSQTSGKRVFYAPGLGALSPEITAAMASADVLLVDGTFWTEDEMITLGLSKKPASAMGHLPQSGPDGMIAILDTMPASRKILIHINNSNPILREDSAERAVLTQHGIEVAHDGMEIQL